MTQAATTGGPTPVRLPPAVVLAGGLGTRLRPVVEDMPKPMAPVGGRPFLALVLDELVTAGVPHAVLAVGYRHEAIVEHFGDEYRGMPLAYSVEVEPLGTGGAVRDGWRVADAEQVLVLNGDTLLGLSFTGLAQTHAHVGAAVTMVVRHVEDTSRYGALDLVAGRVSGFQEKGRPGPGHIYGGVSLLGAACHPLLEIPGPFSLENDVLVRSVATLRPAAHLTDGYFVDIGIPADYARAQQDLGGPSPVNQPDTYALERF